MLKPIAKAGRIAKGVRGRRELIERAARDKVSTSNRGGMKGDIHAILLPLVMEFNSATAETKFAAMARALGVKEEGNSQRELAVKSIEQVKGLLTSVNACRKLPWKEIATNHLEEVAKLTLSTVQADQNPRKASESEIVSLIQKALDGWEMK